MNSRLAHLILLSTALASGGLLAGCGGAGLEESSPEESGPPPVISVITAPVVQGNGELLIPDVATVPVPEAGFQWKLIEQSEENGVQIYNYACTSAGSPEAVSLKILGRQADDFQTRMMVKDKHYKSMIASLENEQCTNIDATTGRYTDPIPDWSQRRLSGVRPDGATVVFKIHTIFGKHVYFVAGVSPTDTKSDELVQAVAKVLVPGQ